MLWILDNQVFYNFLESAQCGVVEGIGTGIWTVLEQVKG